MQLPSGQAAAAFAMGSMLMLTGLAKQPLMLAFKCNWCMHSTCHPVDAAVAS
jgi:hypothetical protein